MTDAEIKAKALMFLPKHLKHRIKFNTTNTIGFEWQLGQEPKFIDSNDLLALQTALEFIEKERTKRPKPSPNAYLVVRKNMDIENEEIISEVAILVQRYMNLLTCLVNHPYDWYVQKITTELNNLLPD